MALAATVAACGSDDDGSDSTAASSSDSTAASSSDSTAASSSDSTDGPSTTTGGEEPRSGGVLTYAYNTDVPNMDPLTFPNFANASGSFGFRSLAIFDALIYEDASGELVYRLAESLTPDASATKWQLKVRPGVTFSDGSPYDAAAIKADWERTKDPASKSPRASSASQMSAIEVVDATTLDITLASPNAQFPRSVALFLTAVQAPAGAAAATAGTAFAIGAGPFKVDSWVPNDKLVLSRNENYWDAPRPYLDGVILKIIPDDAQRSEAFQNDEAQINYSFNFPTVKRERDAGVEHLSGNISGGRAMLLNNTRPPFDDPLARQAMAAALDQQGFVDVVQAGLNAPVENLFADGTAFHDSTPDWPASDPAKAQALLDEYAEKTGGPLTFSIATAVAIRQEGEYFQSVLSQFDNLEVEVEVVETAQVTPILLNKNYDTLLYTLTYVDPEPALSGQLFSTSARNFTGYSSPEMDAALTAGREALDPAAREAAYKEVGEIFNRDLPFIWMSRYTIYQGVSDRVGGAEVFEDGAILPFNLSLKD